MKVKTDNSGNKWKLPFDVVCKQCKSVLLVDQQDDIKTAFGQPQDTDFKAFLYVDCIVCKAMIKVNPRPFELP